MIKILTSIIVIFLLAIKLPDISYAKSPPPGTDASVPANILIMLDTSGSMGTVINSGDSRYPVDIAFDSNGNLLVAKYYDSIEKYDASGNFQASWGGYVGYAADGKFDYISAIDVDSDDNVYVSDRNFGRIQKFDNDGNYILDMDLASSPAQGVAVDGNNDIYAINGSGRIEKFNANGTLLQTWSNSNGTNVAIDSNNNVYVTRYNNNDIQVFDSNGSLQDTISLGYQPFGIHVDNNDLLLVSDNYSRIRQYQLDGTYIQVWGSYGTGTGEFRYSKGIATTSTNEIYVSDYYNHRIQSIAGDIFNDSSVSETRLEQAVRVIKEIVSDSDLTEGANFGLMEWNSNSTMHVNISSSGAGEIFNMIDTLTDGGGTYLDTAMNLASSYFLGDNSPMDGNLDCQKNILIVVSDGFWNDTTASNTAQSLYNNHGIETFVVGFQTTGNNNYITLSQKGGTYPDSPLYANNWQQLYSVLSSYISQLISSNLTFVAPTVIPGVEGDDYIIQSTFTYKSTNQWKGRLKKYALTDEGGIGSTLWDAGDLLNERAASDRNIWTISSGLSITGYNNFITNNRDRLRSGLDENLGVAMDDSEIDNLINFVRGNDSYNEFPSGTDDEGSTLLEDERWKLADVYNSRAVVVPSPSAYSSDESNSNSEAYYRSQNGYSAFKTSDACGVICNTRDEVVFVGSNSGMLHAFDADTGEEKWAFIPPSVLPVLKDMIANNAGESVSIYAVDGTVTVKDIYYDDSWHTILMGGLRQGGNSYYALNITDIDNPTHLFTFDHNTLNNTVSYWDENGTRTTYNLATDTPSSALDFSRLGESWSQPIILKLRINSADKWVAVIAGGYNNASNPNYGTNVYVLDLENGGQIIQSINLPDTISGNDIVSSIPPKVTAISADSSTTFTSAGALIYVTDLEGKLWKINMTDTGTMYSKTQIFNVESTDANGRYSFHEMTATLTEDGRLMNIFGTGNLQRLESASANIQNRLYGVYDNNYPLYSTVSSFDISSMQDGSVSCPTELQKGWYINLNSNEKVTGKITLENSTIFSTIFAPNSSNQCDSGDSYLLENNFMCGTNISTNSLGGGIATEAVVYNNKIYIGISNDSTTPDSLPAGFTKVGNLIIGTPTNQSEPNIKIEGWWEEF